MACGWKITTQFGSDVDDGAYHPTHSDPKRESWADQHAKDIQASRFKSSLVLPTWGVKASAASVAVFIDWLVVEPTPLKNIRQNGNLLQVGVKIKDIWNHHRVDDSTKCAMVKSEPQKHGSTSQLVEWIPYTEVLAIKLAILLRNTAGC